MDLCVCALVVGWASGWVTYPQLSPMRFSGGSHQHEVGATPSVQLIGLQVKRLLKLPHQVIIYRWRERVREVSEVGQCQGWPMPKVHRVMVTDNTTTYQLCSLVGWIGTVCVAQWHRH